MQFHLGLIHVNDRACNDSSQQCVVSPPIISSKQVPERKDIRQVHLNTERFMEKRCQRSCAKSMCDLVVHGPAHKAMKMPRQPMIALRHKAMSALGTPIGHSSAFDNLAFDRSRCGDDVESTLTPRLESLWPVSCGDSDEIPPASANRTDQCSYFHPMRRADLSVLPSPLDTCIPALLPSESET